LHIQRAETIERFGKALIAVANGAAAAGRSHYVAEIRKPADPARGLPSRLQEALGPGRAGGARLFDACREMLAMRTCRSDREGMGVGLG